MLCNIKHRKYELQGRTENIARHSSNILIQHNQMNEHEKSGQILVQKCRYV